MGPPMFICDVNGMSEVVPSTIGMFIDDTKML